MLQIKTDLYRYVHYTSNVAVCNYQELIGCDVSFMVVLISDLCEGNTRQNLYGVCHDILESGARLVALTALDENAAPAYDRSTAEKLAGMGAWVGAMTPARLANFMADVMRD